MAASVSSVNKNEIKFHLCFRRYMCQLGFWHGRIARFAPSDRKRSTHRRRADHQTPRIGLGGAWGAQFGGH